MSYIDGFLIPVPENKKDDYRRLAEWAATIFQEHGALQVVECWGDDIPAGKLTDFYRAVQVEPGETIVFAWIVWPSREARDEGNRKVMTDPRMQPMNDMPFDGKRMIFGGFTPLFDSGSREAGTPLARA